MQRHIVIPLAGSAKLKTAFVLVIYIITSNNWTVWCMSCMAVSTNSAVWVLQLSKCCEVHNEIHASSQWDTRALCSLTHSPQQAVVQMEQQLHADSLTWFPSLDTDLWGLTLFCGRPVLLYNTFSLLPGFCPLDASIAFSWRARTVFRQYPQCFQYLLEDKLKITRSLEPPSSVMPDISGLWLALSLGCWRENSIRFTCVEGAGWPAPVATLEDPACLPQVGFENEWAEAGMTFSINHNVGYHKSINIFWEFIMYRISHSNDCMP